MTLEDFFTLAEMKDGLTVPARVKELVNIMQEEKHSIVKNVGDVTRQWSTVASTIAATENKKCLYLFLQLDGICYLDSWLKDAQKFGSQPGDGVVEESISELLGAIGKLHVHSQKSVNSGILMTVKNLLWHNSSRVQDKARTLLDSFKQTNKSIVTPEDASKLEASCEGQSNTSENPSAERDRPECSSHDISPFGGSDNECENVEASDKMMESTDSESHKQKGVDSINIQTSDRILDQEYMKDGTPDSMCGSDRLKPVSGNSSVQEITATYGSEAPTGNGNGGFAVPKHATLGGQPDVSNSSDHDDVKQIQQTRKCDKSDAIDTSGVDFAKDVESKTELDMDENVDAKEDNNCKEVFPSGNGGIDVSNGEDGMGNAKSAIPCRKTLQSKATNQDQDSNADVLQNKMDHKLEIREALVTDSSRIEDTGVTEESIEQDNDETEGDLGNDLKFPRSTVESKDSDVIDRRPDIKLDYDTVDPLEVAHQVAIGVERHVDCRDTSCSSSERTSGGGIRLTRSPDSINAKKGREIHGPSKDVPTGPSLSIDSGDGTFINTENRITKQESHIPDMNVTQGIEEALKTETNTDKLVCGFDLNEEMLSDDVEHNIIPLAAPVSVVSASRAAAATGLRNAPLQFEGSLQWKGSAETSAFRPAPPRRASDGERPLFASESHNISTQRQNFLDFDLNVAEHEDDKITDLMLGKETPSSFGRPSGDSFVEVASPKRSDRVQLDLNRVSDGNDAPSHWRKEGMLLQHRNCHRSPSPSSSSMQPTLRNIDLNDQPSIVNDFSVPAFFGNSQISSTTGGFKSDDSVISIMGAKVEINRRDSVPQTIPLPLFPNGRTSDFAVDDSSTRMGSVLGMGSAMPYASATVYGYNEPPSRSAMPFSSAMYGLGGHIPYMVNSRGSPVVPQILGSASAIPAAFSQQPFIMSMAGAPTGLNGVGPLQHNFDLNSGLMGDGRDTGGLRNLFNSGQGRQVDEHSRANPQPTSSSSVGGKRKETEGGWEPFPFNYKHNQPPWK